MALPPNISRIDADSADRAIQNEAAREVLLNPLLSDDSNSKTMEKNRLLEYFTEWRAAGLPISTEENEIPCGI